MTGGPGVAVAIAVLVLSLPAIGAWANATGRGGRLWRWVAPLWRRVAARLDRRSPERRQTDAAWQRLGVMVQEEVQTLAGHGEAHPDARVAAVAAAYARGQVTAYGRQLRVLVAVAAVVVVAAAVADRSWSRSLSGWGWFLGGAIVGLLGLRRWRRVLRANANAGGSPGADDAAAGPPAA